MHLAHKNAFKLNAFQINAFPLNAFAINAFCAKAFATSEETVFPTLRAASAALNIPGKFSSTSNHFINFEEVTTLIIGPK